MSEIEGTLDSVSLSEVAPPTSPGNQKASRDNDVISNAKKTCDHCMKSKLVDEIYFCNSHKLVLCAACSMDSHKECTSAPYGHYLKGQLEKVISLGNTRESGMGNVQRDLTSVIDKFGELSFKVDEMKCGSESKKENCLKEIEQLENTQMELKVPIEGGQQIDDLVDKINSCMKAYSEMSDPIYQDALYVSKVETVIRKITEAIETFDAALVEPAPAAPIKRDSTSSSTSKGAKRSISMKKVIPVDFQQPLDMNLSSL